MLGPSQRAVVVIDPPPQTGEETSCVVVSTAVLKLPDGAWNPLPRFSRLGVDLLYAKPTTTNNFPFDVGVENSVIRTLTLDCDPASASFGSSDFKASGGVAFRFADKRMDVSKAVLQLLVRFITNRINMITVARIEGTEKAKAESEKMNPQAFKEFFKRNRAQMAEHYPGKGWETVECPVRSEMLGCEMCGKQENAGAGGDGMMRCARCKKVRYCDQACQAADWKMHKPFCAKG